MDLLGYVERVLVFVQLIVFFNMYIYMQTPSRVLETGVNTTQKTLVLKKQAELDEVDKQLTLKRQEFKSYVEALARRRSELEIKQQQVNGNLPIWIYHCQMTLS